MGELQKHGHPHYQQRQPEETVLYQVLAEHLETFIAQREMDGKGLPKFVIKELRGFLRCGVIQYGFLRTKCKGCDFERAVPFSCKGRGFCPSCCGKRMAEKAFQQALEYGPRAARLHYNYGTFLLQQERPEEALEHLTRTIRLGWSDANAYVNRGVALWKLKRTKKAAESFRNALGRDPLNRRAKDNLEKIDESTRRAPSN